MAPTTQLLSTDPGPEQDTGQRHINTEHQVLVGGQGVVVMVTDVSVGLTFELQVGFGDVQLVAEGHAGVLHASAGLELNAQLQLWTHGRAA